MVVDDVDGADEHLCHQLQSQIVSPTMIHSTQILHVILKSPERMEGTPSSLHLGHLITHLRSQILVVIVNGGFEAPAMMAIKLVLSLESKQQESNNQMQNGEITSEKCSGHKAETDESCVLKQFLQTCLCLNLDQHLKTHLGQQRGYNHDLKNKPMNWQFPFSSVSNR